MFDAAKPTNNTDVNDHGTPKITLMIYMIGSDLESKCASATTDMEEIAASKIDTSVVNLLVLSGGSEQWHNGLSSDEITLQLLTKDGFVKQDYKDSGSMGEPGCLQRFLDYSYNNYKTDEYDLILWDHGNGPIIGYGKDTLNDNDSLTLTEMRQALTDSRFGEDNKLGFIGFDACLMASAELVLAVHDYADYLVASQEIEPVFGWNYSFLSDLGQKSTEGIAKEIADSYKEYSDAYFADKEYFRSPVTMSVIDLSQADELERSIDALFADASNDVSGHYVQLARKRAMIKSPGRGSTGSEYDFVDLISMANALSDDYQTQTSDLKSVLSKTIVYNVSSEDDYCGLSLYYPFYNKNYYRKSWHDEYLKLGLFTDYLNYLSRFDQIWLGSDYGECFENLGTIEAGDIPNSFSLELTPEQQQYYLSGGYYIMRKFVDPSDGHEEYGAVYYSPVTDYDNGIITANYDGKALFFVDDNGKRGIPLTKQVDYNNGVCKFYSVFVLSDSDISSGNVDAESTRCIMYFSYDIDADKFTVDGTYESEAGIYDLYESELSSGKKVPVQIKDWNVFTFYNLPNKIITRNENGLIKDYNEWEPGEWYTWQHLWVKNNVRPSYETIYDYGDEYFIMFDISDVQGGKYCSELYPIVLPQKNDDTEDAEEFVWQDNGVTIYDDNEIKISLKYTLAPDKRGYLYMECENKNNHNLRAKINDFAFNNTKQNDEIICYFFDGRDLWTIQDITDIQNPNEIEFNFILTDYTTYEDLAHKRIKVTIPKDAFRVEDGTNPVLGASASKQTIFSKDDVDINLNYLGYGGGADRDLLGYSMAIDLEVRNRSSQAIKYEYEGIIVNGIYISDLDLQTSIGPGEIFNNVYYPQKIEDAGNHLTFYWYYDIDKLPRIKEISSLSIVVNVNGTEYVCDVELKEHADFSRDIIGNDILYEDDTVRVLVAPGGKLEKDDDETNNLFVLWIINKTDRFEIFHWKKEGDSDTRVDSVIVPGGYAAISVINDKNDLNGKWPKYYLSTFGDEYRSSAFEIRY